MPISSCASKKPQRSTGLTTTTQSVTKSANNSNTTSSNTSSTRTSRHSVSSTSSLVSSPTNSNPLSGLNSPTGMRSPTGLRSPTGSQGSSAKRLSLSQPGATSVSALKQRYSSVTSKVGSLDNIHFKPKQTENRIFSEKLSYREQAKPLIDAGDKEKSSKKSIPSEPKKIIINHPKPRYASVKSKVGSKDNIHYKPKETEKQIFNEKLTYREQAKPLIDAGDKEQRRKKSIQSENKKTIISKPIPHYASVKSRVGSKDNIHYKPKETEKRIFSEKLSYREQAKPLIDAGDKKRRSSDRSGTTITSPSPTPLSSSTTTPIKPESQLALDITTPPQSPPSSSKSGNEKQLDSVASTIVAVEDLKI
ncbi:uncharacterized protein BX664DRAFT_387924 [Halteromyces radiatus]|uniref:uncharacterized protein n=1 Tax=Halteromyces radiatus TaxID=101107 RepID=UPI00221E54E4|nr:uncharacterized protein BX664DRAFT_387924 [Halteromyces radiatus]KAI8082778.1 hypothetical protein BX664DRAFT_387924 [Halteromyces radiatus]